MKTAKALWNEFNNTVKFYHSDPESQISREDRFIKSVESYMEEHIIEFVYWYNNVQENGELPKDDFGGKELIEKDYTEWLKQ